MAVNGNGSSKKNILIVGSGKRARAFSEKLLNHPQWNTSIVGFLDPNRSRIGKNGNGKNGSGHLYDLQNLIGSHSVDEVLFIVPISMLPKIEKAMAFCEKVGLRTRLAIDPSHNGKTQMRLDDIAGWRFITFDPPPHPKRLLIIKRFMDVILSAIILIMASPLFAAIALGIKLTSRGPVFFKQERWTINGRRFTMLKFRTMVENAEELKPQVQHLNEMSGPVFKVRDDSRVTHFGRFLRKYSLDELPQFFNVLKGDMSIVGPRPLPIPEIEKDDLRQRRRLSMKPGITCLWQVNGRNAIDFENWIKLDLDYIDHWSLGRDLVIILKTVPAMLRGTGV